jgi:beta-galactosidase
MLPGIGQVRPWADPTLTQLNRLPMHVPLDGFPRRSLDGRWSLEMFAHPDRVPAAALTGDRRAAVRVVVPGNWTMQDLGGFVDPPHYTNVRMPFPGPPPRLPDNNPTGVYRRSFTMGASWLKRRTVLHVGGAESVHAVYVNGRFVGYGTDSRLPSEYEIGPFVEHGRNELAIVVVRYSAQSYVEDQDQWWMAGLHRSVWIESRPAVHIADLPVATDFDPTTGGGDVSATAELDVAGAPEDGWRVRSTLRDPAGRQVGSVITAEVPHRHTEAYVFEGFRTTARWAVRRAAPWSAERPDRYALTVELVDPRGRVRQTETQRIGLRRVEVRDRRLLVNGRAPWIFGVNRHDHHPDRGKALTADDLRADLTVMRRHNITAIRTSHYPNDSAFYNLCDELGFYVVDEANIESHAYNTSLCDDPGFRSTWLERGARMVRRDRNHPLHHEGEILHRGWDRSSLGDIVCPMYPEIDGIVEFGSTGRGDRPLIMSEYSHAMGNSNGSLADYWDVITSTPGLQGGFVWEWKDQALRQRLPDGRTRLAYGGQFGDTPHDGNFVADGLVSAELEPHPAMRELAWVHRPVTVSRTRAGLRIENRRSFVDLGDLRSTWELSVDGGVVRRGVLGLPRVSAAATTTVALPCEVPATAGAVHLAVRWETREESWYAPAGHLVAWDQIELRRGRRRHQSRGSGSAADRLVEPRLNLWRAATDNDGFKLMLDRPRRRAPGVALRGWLAAGLDRLDPEELVAHEMHVEHDAHGSTYRHVVDVPESLDDLPRVGVLFTVPGRFRRLRWYGRGPHENYPDRNRSAMLGEWEGGPDECPYLVPQEFGLRTDCRWFELIDPRRGQTLRIDVVQPSGLHVSATHHLPADLFAAPTVSELHRRSELVVCLDVAHRGLGTASCGPDVLPEYRLAPGRHEFGYHVSLH